MKHQQNYYDRDFRSQPKDDNETEHRNNREVLHYGDENYLEVDSVGQVDDVTDFLSKSEVTYETSKVNKIGKHSTSNDKWMSDKTADTFAPEGGVNCCEDVTSGHITQGMNSTISNVRKCYSSKSFNDVSTISVFNKPVEELHDKYSEDRTNRKRKRQNQHYEQKQKIKLQRKTEPTHCFENNKPHSNTSLKYLQKHIYVSPTPHMPISSSVTTLEWSTFIDIQNNSSNESKQGRRDYGGHRQVWLEPMEMSGPPLKDSKYINNSSKKDTRLVFLKEDTQKRVFHQNLKESSKESIDQLVKEVYKALVIAEENDIPAKHVMEILRNNESLQIEFENEDELMFLLKSDDDKFLLKPALGQVLISPRTNIKICQAFTKDQSIKHACMDLHICKYFLLGKCSIQSCKFSHRLKSKHNTKVLREHDLEGLPEKAVKTLVSSIYNRNISTTPLICKFYNNKGYNKIVSSESTVQSIGKGSDMARVSSEGANDNQEPDDTVETSGISQDYARLTDNIPLGQDEIFFQPECDNCNNFSNGETKREEDAKKHFLPAWTPIRPVEFKRTTEENGLVTSNKTHQDIEVTARSKSSIADPNEDIIATKGTCQIDKLPTVDGVRRNQKLKDLAQTDNKLLHIQTERAISENTSNYSKPIIAHNNEETTLIKSSNQTNDSKEIGTDDSNITAVILEVTEKKASYKLRKDNKQWQFEDNINQWVSLEWKDSEILDNLFNQTAEDR